MATVDDSDLSLSADAPLTTSRPLLVDGQRLDQPTFHNLYEQMTEDFRAELIDGVVTLMNMPVFEDHGRPDASLIGLLFSYSIETPGTILQSNTTTKLAPSSEVQPDSVLRIDPACGGRTVRDPKGYTVNAPEFIVEISSSTLRIDLNAKKKVYEEAGALEYVVYDVLHQKFHWFILRDGRFEPLPPDPDGLYRSQAFPGLWLDEAAFVRDDGRALLAALQQGLASPEHAAFVEQLRQNRANRP